MDHTARSQLSGPAGASAPREPPGREGVFGGTAPPQPAAATNSGGAYYGAGDYTPNEQSTSQLPRNVLPTPNLPYTATDPPLKPRFGRWGRWIENRAQQRRDEQAELRAAGLVKSSSWSLPGQDRGSSPLRRDPSALRRDEEAERTLSRDHLILVTNADSSPASSTQSRSASPAAAAAAGAMPRRPRTSSSASVSAAVQPLTHHVRIERVGERFGTGLPEQPLCGCPLPIGPQASTARFTLIGTRRGLYVLDAQPNAGIALSAASGDSAARHHALWTGLGVHHIETYAETDPYAESPRGLVLALVDGTHGELELRMWNLASIVNLVKWRVYSATSVVLSLEPESPAHHSAHARTRSAFGVKSPTSPEGSSTNTKRWSSSSMRQTTRAAPPAQSRPNGTSPTRHANASPFRFPLSPNARSTPESELGYDSCESPMTPLSSTSHLSLHSQSRPRSASETSHLELPLEWATASVALPVPKSAGSILFFRLFRRPRPSRRRKREFLDSAGNPVAYDSDSSDDSDADFLDERLPQMGSTARSSGPRHHLYMFVATSRSVFLYESEPVERRTWHLAKEYLAPSTPRFVHLLRTGIPIRDPVGASSLPADISLLLGTSHHLVLIRLCDSTVSELKVPGLDSRHAHSQVNRGQSVSTAKPPSGVKRSQSQQHRKASPSFAASLRDLNAKMARLIDGGDRALPAGLRGIDSDFVKSRVVSDEGDEGTSDHSRAAAAGGGSGGGSISAHPKWIGCCEVTIPGRAAGSVQVLLLSTARVSYLVAIRRDHDPDNSTPVLLHTFTWTGSTTTALVHVAATVSPAPERATTLRATSSSLHLSLVGFTHTGVLVSEHLVSSAAILSRVFADSAAPPDLPIAVPVVARPLSSRPVALPPNLALSPPHHEDPDLSDRAAFDFGRAIGRVCPIVDGLDVVESTTAAAVGGRADDVAVQQRQQQRSEYFWVQGRAEWTLKRLVCESLSPALS